MEILLMSVVIRKQSRKVEVYLKLRPPQSRLAQLASLRNVPLAHPFEIKAVVFPLLPRGLTIKRSIASALKIDVKFSREAPIAQLENVTFELSEDFDESDPSTESRLIRRTRDMMAATYAHAVAAQATLQPLRRTSSKKVSRGTTPVAPPSPQAARSPSVPPPAPPPQSLYHLIPSSRKTNLISE